MKRRVQFSLAAPCELESRVVPSGGGARGGRGQSVVVATLYPHHQVLSRTQQSVEAMVDQAFASFTSDYDQARAVYFASILNTSTTSDTATAAKTAFTNYTQQRVSLLAQQIISSFLQAPTGTSRANGQQSVLQILINQKIGGSNGLSQTLVNTIPAPGSSQSIASLDSLSQDNAIQAAQATVINAINIIRHGY